MSNSNLDNNLVYRDRSRNMEAQMSTEDILRQRLREYRELLDIAYHMVEGTPSDAARLQFLEKCNKNGIGLKEQEPVVKGVNDDEYK